MSKGKHGASLYYATDKNLFDALNQSKVDAETVQNIFTRRNIVTSKKTPRSDLSLYFSRLSHDYLDHKDLSIRLGITSRRERITSIDLDLIPESEVVDIAIQQLTESLRKEGDLVHVSSNGKSISLNVKFTEIDYKRSEFSQVQHRDGQIELVKVGNEYVVRSTQSEYVNRARDLLIKYMEEGTGKSIGRSVVSLFDITSPKTRSQFFFDLMTTFPNYVRRDVTEVYVFKARPNDDSDNPLMPDESESHVERVFLRGNELTQSSLLTDLIQGKDYYISKVSWIAVETLGKGYGYEIEAMFHDPKECTGFSYLLKGVFPLEESGKLVKRRRPPELHEIEAISRDVENHARGLIKEIRANSL